MNKTLTAGMALAGLLLAAPQASAENKVAVHGSVQADIVFPEVDDDINTGTYAPMGEDRRGEIHCSRITPNTGMAWLLVAVSGEPR